LDAELGLQRRRAGAAEWNRLDDYALDFHRRVRAGYHELMQLEPERWVKLDAARSVEEVRAEIWKIVSQRLKTTG
ncbi:MAG: hypothetical protein NZM11_10250, partial [Anaerolineales bacterium]|nr:hypothetical protein [Anaerolineales bacterium]